MQQTFRSSTAVVLSRCARKGQRLILLFFLTEKWHTAHFVGMTLQGRLDNVISPGKTKSLCGSGVTASTLIRWHEPSTSVNALPLHRILEEAANCYVWYKHGGNFEEKSCNKSHLLTKNCLIFFGSKATHTDQRKQCVVKSWAVVALYPLQQVPDRWLKAQSGNQTVGQEKKKGVKRLGDI